MVEVAPGNLGRLVGWEADQPDPGGADARLGDRVAVAPSGQFAGGGRDTGRVGGLDGLEDQFALVLEEAMEEQLVVPQPAPVEGSRQPGAGLLREALMLRLDGDCPNEEQSSMERVPVLICSRICSSWACREAQSSSSG